MAGAPRGPARIGRAGDRSGADPRARSGEAIRTSTGSVAATAGVAAGMAAGISLGDEDETAEASSPRAVALAARPAQLDARVAARAGGGRDGLRSAAARVHGPLHHRAPQVGATRAQRAREDDGGEAERQEAAPVPAACADASAKETRGGAGGGHGAGAGRGSDDSPRATSVPSASCAGGASCAPREKRLCREAAGRGREARRARASPVDARRLADEAAEGAAQRELGGVADLGGDGGE